MNFKMSQKIRIKRPQIANFKRKNLELEKNTSKIITTKKLTHFLFTSG